MRWQQGREAVDGMITRGELERVPASRDHADLSAEEVQRDVPKVEQIIDVATRVLDQMSPL